MSEEKPSNVDLLRGAYRQWVDTGGTCIEGWLAIVDESVICGSMGDDGHSAFVPTASVRTRLHHHFEKQMKEWSLIQFMPSEYLAQGDIVLMRGFAAMNNKKTNKTVVTPKLDFWRFRDGKIVEFYEYLDTAAYFSARA